MFVLGTGGEYLRLSDLFEYFHLKGYYIPAVEYSAEYYEILIKPV